MNELMPEVLQAVAVEPYLVDAYMNDGSVRRFNVLPLIEKGGVFAQLRDQSLFKTTLTVMNGTIAWDVVGNRDTYKCIDIDPCSLQELPPIKAPDFV